MRTLFQDFRYALRLFMKKPGFTAIAVLTLGLGIGVNTAVFSVVNNVLLRPLPYKDPDRIIKIQSTPAPSDEASVYSYPVFDNARQQGQSFAGVTAFAYRRLTFDTSEGPEIVLGSRVTSDFFSVLGVEPMMGRAFLPGEDEPNKPSLVVLSHGLWQRRFGADPNIIGKAFTSEKETVEIVGVMPSDFKFNLLSNIPDVEFWTPLNPSPGMKTADNVRWLNVIARLKSEATLAQAQTEIGVIAEQIRQSGEPSSQRAGNEVALSAITLKEFFVGDTQKPLLILLGAVGFVLLIACVNVANLLLAHGVGRQKEIAIRVVLGASRLRLISQMLTESLALSLMGGLLGYLLVSWSLQGIIWLTPKEMIRMEEISLDQKVFLFTMATSLFTGILFGLLPSLHASKPDLQSTLKLGASMAGGMRGGFRRFLVVAEVALAVILLVGAGLMINSFIRLTSVDVGFNPENVLSMELRMLSRQTEPEQTAFAQEVIERIQNLPGVNEAALIDSLPITGGSSQTNKRSSFLEAPFAGNPDEEIAIEPRSISHGYFQTMGMRLVSGRLFTDADTSGSQPVVVVSEQMARQVWPGEDPIGKRLLWTWIKNRRPVAIRPAVIGVVSDIRNHSLTQEPTPLLYFSFNQSPDSRAFLVTRASADPLNLMSAIREHILSIDRRVAVADVMTMEQRLGDLVAQPRFYAVLLGWFGAMGMLLSVIGLYGVISYSVNQMTREIGIRMALGAQPENIFKLVVGQGMILTLVGVAIGISGAFALTRFLESLLFNISPTDPITFAGVSLMLAIVAALACYIPARRASKVDPMVALRYE